MFDTVGRTQQRQAKRQAGALLLSLLVNGGFMGGLVWAGSRVVDEVTKTDDVVEVPVDLSAPPPPPPPPPAGGSHKPHTEKKVEEKPKVEVVQDVVPLDPTPPDPPATPDPEPAGVDGGVEGGVEGGVVGGVVGGVIGGQLGGQLGGTGVKVVYWADVQAKVRPTIRPSDYPDAATALKLPPTRCTVRINIDEKGIPTDVAPKECPEIFRPSAVNIGMRYRFYPLKEAGKPIKCQFDLAINFTPP